MNECTCEDPFAVPPVSDESFDVEHPMFFWGLIRASEPYTDNPTSSLQKTKVCCNGLLNIVDVFLEDPHFDGSTLSLVGNFGDLSYHSSSDVIYETL
jgi:hypothetical protein